MLLLMLLVLRPLKDCVMLLTAQHAACKRVLLVACHCQIVVS